MTRTRDDIEQDLVFAVNGTLAETEIAEIQSWLAGDDSLRAEFEALSQIRSDMQAEAVQPPGEFGLARLLRDVGREGAALAAPSAPSRTWMWQMAAAVATVALLGQTLLMGGVGDVADRAPAGYQMAGLGATADLVVSFVPEATEEQIRTLLVGLDVEIVAGPSALGFYDLDVLEGADQNAALQGLRAATGIIESVENAEN